MNVDRALALLDVKRKLLATPLDSLGRVARHRLDKIKRCGNMLILRDDGTIAHSSQRINMFPCGYRNACPFCAHVARRKRLARIHQWIEKTQPEYIYGATLTVEHQADEPLIVVLERLRSTWQRVRLEIAEIRKGRHAQVITPPRGIVYGSEIIRGQNGWHPHLHMIITSDTRIEYKQFNIFLNAALPWRAHFHFSPLRTPRDRVEFAKYSFKWNDATELDEVLRATRGKRTSGTIGDARGLVPPDSFTPEPRMVRFVRHNDLLRIPPPTLCSTYEQKEDRPPGALAREGALAACPDPLDDFPPF